MACCADATAACLMALNSVALSALVVLGCLAAISATVNACKQDNALDAVASDDAACVNDAVASGDTAFGNSAFLC